MVQATTPTFTMTLPNTVDLSSASSVVFTIRQDDERVDKFDGDLTISTNVVEATLTQAESLRFNMFNEAKLQLNWIYSDGSRGCSKIKTVIVGENLHDEVIS